MGRAFVDEDKDFGEAFNGNLRRRCAATSERLCDDLEAGAGGRDHDQDRQPYVSGDGRHRLLENGGNLERAAQMANHASTRTTQLYDQRAEEVTLDEVERITL